MAAVLLPGQVNATSTRKATGGPGVGEETGEEEDGPHDFSVPISEALEAVGRGNVRATKQQIQNMLKEVRDQDAADANKEKNEERAYMHEIAKTFVKSMRHTTDSLKTDRDLLYKVVKEHKDGWRLLKTASDELRNDRELLLAAVKGSASGWKAILTAPKSLREDRDLCTEVVRRNAAALEYLPPVLRHDSRFVSEALESFKKRLQAIPDRKNGMYHWNQVKVNDAEPKTTFRVIEQVAERHGIGRASALEQQLEAGLGVVKTSEDSGATFRTVLLVNLWIRDSKSGLVLVVLGRSIDGILQPRLMLPGKKIPEGSQPRDACTEFLNTELFRLKNWLEVNPNFDTVVEESESQSFGMHTIYRKASFKVAGRQGLPWKKAAAKITKLKSPAAFSPPRNLTRRHLNGNVLSRPPKPPEMYTLHPPDGQTLDPLEKVDVYAWLPVWEYEWLSTSNLGHTTLKDWIDSIDLQAHLHSVQSGSQMLHSSIASLPPASARESLEHHRSSGVSSVHRPTSQSIASARLPGVHEECSHAPVAAAATSRDRDRDRGSSATTAGSLAAGSSATTAVSLAAGTPRRPMGGLAPLQKVPAAPKRCW